MAMTGEAMTVWSKWREENWRSKYVLWRTHAPPTTNNQQQAISIIIIDIDSDGDGGIDNIIPPILHYRPPINQIQCFQPAPSPHLLE
jgi:hypothetical protein